MIWAKKRFKVLQRDNFRCQYCWKNWKDVSLEVDHIIPKSKWWTDEFDNLITCCRECNIGKWDEFVWPSVNIWKLRLAEHEWKTVKWFFDEWNKRRYWEISKKNLSFISWFIQIYYNYTEFRDNYIGKEKANEITQAEFEEWGDKCEKVLKSFDSFAMADLDYILDNMEDHNDMYEIWREWETDDYNVRLNRLITYQMVWLRFPKSFIYKYSLCPNKVEEWEKERNEY